MESMVIDKKFFKDKTVLITGHTGFKGTWLCKILTMFGANVIGYALSPSKEGSILYNESKIENQITSIIGDVRDYVKLKEVFDKYSPEIVMHLAAQPIVLESYKNPVETYSINVMGTVNILECIRNTNCVKSFLNVTTDKVYENKEWFWGYRENEPLDGFDPYSNSKSCSELVTHSYKNSFFSDGNVAISTARAGNVIGGGDFAINRIIPDCIRAVYKKEEINVRNPYSIRPYQHVLEPLFAYLMIVEKQYKDKKYAGYYNVGPDECDCVTTGELVDIFCEKWGNHQTWKNVCVENPHEANFLKLDCSKIKFIFNWQPHWHINKAIEKTVEWAKAYQNKEDISFCMEKQIKEFLEEK